MHLFMKTILSPSMCLVLDCDEDMETLTDANTLTLQMLNTDGEPYYLDSTLILWELLKMLNIGLLFNISDSPL